jgi:hypothetical protein
MPPPTIRRSVTVVTRLVFPCNPGPPGTLHMISLAV